MTDPLESYLLPGETIRLRNIPVQYGGQDYEFIITNKRIILYAKRGLIFKRDNFVSFKVGEIQDIKYREEGTISKKGILRIDLPSRRIELTGSPSSMKAIYQNIMQFWG